MSPAPVDSGWSGEAFGQGKVAWWSRATGCPRPWRPTSPTATSRSPSCPAARLDRATSPSPCYGVAADAANPEASWALVDYLTNEEGSLAWTEAFSVMPARQSVAEQWISAHPELEPFVAGADYSQRWGFVPGFGDVLGVFNTGTRGRGLREHDHRSGDRRHHRRRGGGPGRMTLGSGGRVDEPGPRVGHA